MTLVVTTSGLTEMQAAFVAAYVISGEARASAVAAGYEHPETGYQCLRSSAVQAAIRDHLERVLKIEGGRLGVTTMVRLAKEAKSEAIQYQAAKWLAEASGYGAKDQKPGEKPIAEMTAAELAKLGDMLERRVRDGETPLIRQSSPDMGRIAPLADGEVQLEQ